MQETIINGIIVDGVIEADAGGPTLFIGVEPRGNELEEVGRWLTLEQAERLGWNIALFLRRAAEGQ